ncbi:hypothetical protein B7Z28_00810 [Candidatus Saccharibacteria bacterium 32-45-3]|nr:MAG: hypothetical protein B7Z28_00810 [Candidatus Saccharibacteria bacterium 32-45-3]
MTKIPTKTLLSLLIASATIARQPTLGTETLANKRDERLARLLQRHDRKGELRASLLNVDPADLTRLHKKYSLKELVHQHGFLDMKGFRYALHGKIKDELHTRGWSSGRIQARITKKLKNSDPTA